MSDLDIAIECCDVATSVCPLVDARHGVMFHGPIELQVHRQDLWRVPWWLSSSEQLSNSRVSHYGYMAVHILNGKFLKTTS